MTVDEDHVVRSWEPSGHRAGVPTTAEADAGPASSRANGGPVAFIESGVTMNSTRNEPEEVGRGAESGMEVKTEEIVLKDGDVDITVTVTRTRISGSRGGPRSDGGADTSGWREGGKGAARCSAAGTSQGEVKLSKRPKYPPMLFARYPYTYASAPRIDQHSVAWGELGGLLYRRIRHGGNRRGIGVIWIKC
jgi:hypothetical protein